LLLEDPDANPFSRTFLPGLEALCACQTQLFFLFQRVQQLVDSKQIDLFEGGNRPLISSSTRIHCSPA